VLVFVAFLPTKPISALQTILSKCVAGEPPAEGFHAWHTKMDYVAVERESSNLPPCPKVYFDGMGGTKMKIPVFTPAKGVDQEGN